MDQETGVSKRRSKPTWLVMAGYAIWLVVGFGLASVAVFLAIVVSMSFANT
jgi:hypothetical protein